MERAHFEKLLEEEESTTLDFKSEQYPFAKATEDQKSELLKDIVTFANVPRPSDAYILIGVAEVRGGRHKVVGIKKTDHLPDHSLQQFVHNLTDCPVRFLYEAFDFEGKQVGIIRIEKKQVFPICLKQNYGKLKKGNVYFRRGSSSDSSKPASAQEIAWIAQTAGPPPAQLAVEFADAARNNALGDKLTWDAEFVERPPVDQIPDFEPARRDVSGIALPAAFDPWNRQNPDYLRELADFEFVRRLYRPVRLVVRNVGDVAAKNVRCELTTRADIDVRVIDAADRPDAPKPRGSARDSAAIKGIKPLSQGTPGDVAITKDDERYVIEIECRDLQPGRRVWSDVFYVGKEESGEVELAGRILAENLAQPKEFMLTISAKISRPSLTVNDLRDLPEPPT